MLAPDLQEQLRHAALEALVYRHPTALPVPGIARRVGLSVDFRFEPADLSSALELLRGLGYAASTPDPLGSSAWWTATAAGKLFLERGGAG